MAILIDGDGSNNIHQIVTKAKKEGKEVHIFCDTTHVITDNYAQVHYISQGKDAVDIAIFNMATTDDLVITNDSGLAALLLPKKIKVCNTYAKFYKDEDSDKAIMMRYLRAQRDKKKRGSRRKKDTRISIKNFT